MTIPEEDFKILRTVADKRHEFRKNQAHNTPVNDNYEILGLMGEYCFSKIYGIKMDLSIKGSGDGGIDFYVNDYFIDVKSASFDYGLKVREESLCAKENFIYVLAFANVENRTTHLIRWEFGSTLKNFYVGYKNKYGFINYEMKTRWLKDISCLKDTIKLLPKKVRNEELILDYYYKNEDNKE